MNRLAKLIEELSLPDLQLLKKDLEAGNLQRLLDARIQKLTSSKVCPTCGAEISQDAVRYALEFGPNDLRQRAYFDEYDCLQYFLDNTVEKPHERH